MNRVTADEMRAVAQSRVMSIDFLFDDFDRLIQSPESVHRIRRFILDLAVRGKLVPQDPNDEPASELLKRIVAEKARLVKAGEIRKPKQLPAIDEPPYLLPDSWCWLPIREATSDHGQCVPQTAFTYIDVTAIDKEKGFIAKPKVLQANEAPSRARKIVRKGDVVYSCVRPYLLNVAVVEEDFDPLPIASTAFAVLYGHGLVLPWFQWIVLRSPFMVTRVEEEMRGQAYPAINDSDFARLPFPLPPLPEQHRIVAKVNELMALCDRLEAARADREATRDRLATASLARLNAPDPDPETFRRDVAFALNNLAPLTTRPDQIKALRLTILNLAVHGKLVPQGPNDEPASELLKRAMIAKGHATIERKIRKSNAPELSESAGENGSPIHWVWAYLHDFALVLGGKRLPSDASFSPEKTGNIYIRVTDMKDGSISAEDLRYISDDVRARIAKYTIDREDLYITIAGTIGEVGEVPDLFHGQNLTENAAKIVFREVERRFLLLVLRSEDVQEQFQEKTKQMAQPKLALKRISGARIPIPPLAEQRRTVSKVDELMALCDRLEASLATGDNTRRRLLAASLYEALKPDRNCEELTDRR